MFIQKHRIGIFYGALLVFCCLQLYYSYQAYLSLQQIENPTHSYKTYVYGGIVIYAMVSLLACRKLMQRYGNQTTLRIASPSPTNPRNALAKRFKNLKRQARYK